MTAPNILQSLLDAINAPVLVIEAEHIVAANDAFLQETGYSVDDLNGKTIRDLIAPQQHRRVANLSPDNLPAAPLSLTLLLRNELACDVTCSVRTLPGNDTGLLLTLMPATMMGMQPEAYVSSHHAKDNGPVRDHQSIARGVMAITEQRRTLPDLLDGLLDYLDYYVSFTSANICLLEEGRYNLAAMRGYPESFNFNIISNFMSSQVVSDSVVADMVPLLVRDTSENDQWGFISDFEGITSWLAVPIVNFDTVIGIINLDHYEPDQFTQADADLVFAVANQLSQTLANIWLYDRAKYELQEREKAQDVLLDTLIKTDALYQIARLLMQTENLDNVLAEVLHILDLSLESESVLLLTFEDTSGKVKQRYLHGQGDPEWLEKECSSLIAQSISGANGHLGHEMQISSHYTSEMHTLPDGRKAIAGTIKHYGVLIAIRPEDAPDFSAEDYDLFDASTNQLAISMENAALYARMRQSNIRLEHLVDKHVRDLELERQKLRVILDATGEGIFYLEDFRFEYVNPALCRMVGYPGAELIGQKLEFIHIPTETHTEGDVFANLLGSSASFNDHNDVARLRRRDGTEFYAHITFTLVGGPGEQRMRMVGVVRDVSRQLALQEQRMRFITNAAHELRTPLTSFALRLHMIRKQPERMNHHLNSLERVSGYMKDLVEDMLALTRYEKGSMELLRGMIDIRDIILSTRDLVLPFANERQVGIQLNLSDTPIKGYFDSERIGKMIEKLLTNAISFSQHNTDVKVLLDLVEITGLPHARLIVEDTGDTMDAHTLESIFEPFSRPGLGDQVDTGMGLALAHAIARLHGGDIIATSVDNQPNRLVATLPLHPDMP